MPVLPRQLPPISVADLQHVVSRTSEFWHEMRGCRVFVTGGTGFFGSWLLETFLHANSKLGLNASITVLTRSPESFFRKMPHLFISDAITLIKGDVRDFDFPEGHYDYIIHAATAARASLNDHSPLEMYSTITEGTARVLRFAQESKPKTLMLVSSGAVYGSQPVGMRRMSESLVGALDPLDVHSAYAIGKLASEYQAVAHSRTGGYNLKIARGFAFVGPHLPLDEHFAIGNFIRDTLAGKEILVSGDGSPFRSYLYAADLAVWLWRILFDASDCRVYNVGSAQDISIAELAELVSRRLGGKGVHVLRPLDLSKPASRYVPDTNRAERNLGLTVSIELPDAIDRTATWWQRAMVG